MTTMSTNETRKTDPANADHRERIASEAKNLKSDLGDVKDDVSNVTSAAVDCVRSEAEHIAEYAQAGADKVHHYHSQFRRNVSKHPTAAVLTTLGVGIIIGKMIAR